MEVKFACADFTFPMLKHEQSLDIISMLGFEAVDIGLFENRSHLWPSEEFKDLKRNAHYLKGKLHERGLKPADIFLQTDLDFVSAAPNHPNEKVRKKARELFLKTLEYTKECNGKHVTVLPGVYFDEEAKEKSFERCCQELDWRYNEAKKQGIIFAIEPHIGSIAPNPKEVLKLVQDVDGLTLTLDYTHFEKQGISAKEVEPLAEYASHFHARGATKGNAQTTVGDNTINYNRVVEVLKENNYKGYIGLEYVWTEWENMNRVDNLSETILLKNLIKEAFNTVK